MTDKKGVWLEVLDIIIAVIWVGGIVSMAWYGYWILLDHYAALGGDLCHGAWVMWAGGIAVCIIGNSMLPWLIHRFPNGEASVQYVLASRIWAYVMGVATMTQRRGVAIFLDCHVGLKWQPNLFTYFVTMVIMWSLRVTRCTLAPPFVIGYDQRDGLFVADPRFRSKAVKAKDKPSGFLKYVLDHAISQIIVPTCNQMAWKSMWTTMDDVFFTSDPVLSNYISWVGGTIFAFVLLGLQRLIAKLSSNTSWLGTKLCIENIFFMLLHFSGVHFWRGQWYFFAEWTKDVGAVTAGFTYHGAAMAAMLLTCTGHSLYPWTVGIDCETKDGSGVILPISFLRTIYAKYKAHKYDVENDSKQPTVRETAGLNH